MGFLNRISPKHTLLQAVQCKANQKRISETTSSKLANKIRQVCNNDGNTKQLTEALRHLSARSHQTGASTAMVTQIKKELASVNASPQSTVGNDVVIDARLTKPPSAALSQPSLDTAKRSAKADVKNVGMGEWCSSRMRQPLRTDSLTECSAIAVSSETENFLAHVAGSNLSLTMSSDNGSTTGDDVVSDLMRRVCKDSNAKVAVVFGQDNGSPMAMATVLNQDSLRELIKSRGQDNVQFFLGTGVTVAGDGGIEARRGSQVVKEIAHDEVFKYAMGYRSSMS